MTNYDLLPDSIQESLNRFEAAVKEYAHIDNPMRALDADEVSKEYQAAKEELCEWLTWVP